MLQEIANQKGVSCRAQGWKVHLCAAQLLQLVGQVLLHYWRCLVIEHFLLSNSEAFAVNMGHNRIFMCAM